MNVANLKWKFNIITDLSILRIYNLSAQLPDLKIIVKHVMIKAAFSSQEISRRRTEYSGFEYPLVHEYLLVI